MNSSLKQSFKALFVLFLLGLGTQLNELKAQSALTPFADVCENVSFVTLTGGTPVGGIYFGPGVTGTQFDPTAAGGPGTYQIGYQGLGALDTAYQNITVTAVTPAEFTGLDTAYCLEAPSPVALSAVFPLTTGAFGPTSLVTGNNFAIPTTPNTYTIYYHYQNANGCRDTSFKNVRIRPKPAVTFTLGPTQSSVCDKDPAFVISKTTANPATGSFAGTGVVGGNIFDPNASGTGTFKIYYTATGPFGCENVDSTQTITVNPSPTVSFTLPVDSICFNGTAFVLPNGVVGGVTKAGTYSGPGVSTMAPYTFTPLLAGVGTHTITFTGEANGCTNTATRTIRVNPKPTVTFSNVIRRCANDTAFILDIGMPAGGIYSGVGVLPDGVTYDPSTAPGPGQYQLTYIASNNFGCRDTNQQFVTLDTVPQVSISTTPFPAKICLGDTIVLNASSTPTNNVVFAWSPNVGDILPPTATGDNIEFFPTLTRSITLTGRYLNNNCTENTSVEVQVVQPATADVTGDLEICFGDTTLLTASGASTYSWSTGESSSSILATPVWDTTYTVIALSELDGAGKQCSSDTTEVVVVVNSLPMISAGLDTKAFIGDLLPLQGYGGETYVWSGATDPNDFTCLNCENTSVRVFPEDTALSIYYYVIGTDSNGCSNSDSILVSIDENVIVFVPSAFSPNSDGVNDTLFLRAKGIKAFTFQIFNRRGEEVFTTRNLNEGWDGTYEGEPINQEVFVYYLQATPYIREPFKQTGNITIIR